MKKIYVVLICAFAILLIFTGCSSPAVLKSGIFTSEYKDFLKNIQKENPVSVSYEEYLKNDGFDKNKLIKDINKDRLKQLSDALANLKISEEAPDASNFSVKYYCFTDSEGREFVFEFYGQYLKYGNTYYKVDNYYEFTNIALSNTVSENVVLALDCVYYGSPEDNNRIYAGARKITKDAKGKETAGKFQDYPLADEIKIKAPTDKQRKLIKTVSAADFCKSFQSLKGEENEKYYFKAFMKDNVIYSLEYISG